MSLEAQPALEPRMKMRRIFGVNGERREAYEVLTDMVRNSAVNQGGTAE